MNRWARSRLACATLLLVAGTVLGQRSNGSLLLTAITLNHNHARSGATAEIPDSKNTDLAGGKPNIFAPALLKSDGTPDLSGVCLGDPQNAKYLHAVAADFDLWRVSHLAVGRGARQRTDRCAPRRAPWARYSPQGIPIDDTSRFYPCKIIQEPDLEGILSELQRRIFQ